MARTNSRNRKRSKAGGGGKRNGARGAKKSSHNARPANPNLFTRFACETAHLAGKPASFLVALFLVIVWAVTGPVFGYSDTWQLVINTSTTIVTFLMVFLIQNTQNRDTMALQIKLAELIFVVRGAKNRLATAEDLSDDDLEKLHQEFRRRAEHALKALSERRDTRAKS